MALKWSDINWDGNTIHVRRSLLRKPKKSLKEGEKSWTFDMPKTKASIRGIGMSPILKENLEIHKFFEGQRLAELRLKNSHSNEDNLVFTNNEGNPMDGNNLTKRIFNPALKAAGLRHIRFHDLRHTFATLLMAQKEESKFIQSQLGHSSIQTTFDRYGHVMTVQHLEAGIKLDGTIFGVPKIMVENTEVMS